MARVSLAGVNKFYGATQVLHDISLDVADGAFAVFVGPSGCGKSTMLRAIAGLETIATGTIAIGDEDVTRREPSERGVSMVFQSYALYPHMSVEENMAFGLKINGVGPAERQSRIAEAARILQLEAYMRRRPGQLSGGQRQRVAIGRAIVKKPRVFLFDEPLSNLDAKLRIQMRVELETLHKELGATMIYVTHDQVEAMTMASQIVVLNGGRIEQVGAPMDLYHRPRTEFVAGFIGAPSMNFMDVEPASDGVRYAGGVLGTRPAEGGPPVRAGIRPEHIKLAPPASGLKARIEVKEQLGGESFLYTRTATGDRLVVKVDGDEPIGAGADVGLMLPADRLHLFAADGKALTS